MDERTVAQLNAINRDFYARHGASFDSKRRRPWQGWNRVIAGLEKRSPLSILDVGCGNGRFGLFVEEAMSAPVEYWGVDASDILLAKAAERGSESWNLLQADVLDDGWPGEIAARCFDLVVCFGVVHHVPGRARRRTLIEELLDLVAPTGRLAFSIWRFGDRARFLDRTVDWQEWARLSGLTLDMEALEPNDYLLRWGDDGGEPLSSEAALRYCHFVDEEEGGELVGSLPVSEVETFLADGRGGDLNRYFVLRKNLSAG